ncbi:MAG TPA: hypothetical protein VG754_04505, partial [Verrucomicrobiae bacterium]|nr:hypothetical protein [Verrucomicrobiae bacterium]
MKTFILRSLAIAAIACLTVFYTSNVTARPSNSATLLVDAYAALDRADHDYKGHRIDAMKQIEEAAKVEGVNLRGDGRGHEKQGVSDEQLRVAEGFLQQAKGELKGKALKHVNNAL